MPDYLPDKGGIFDSDTHRRTLGHMSEPEGEAISVEELLERMYDDQQTDFTDVGELTTVCDELVSSGFASREGDGFIQAQAGFEALTGPIADEPPPLEGQELEAAEAHNKKIEEEDKKLEEEGSGHGED